MTTILTVSIIALSIVAAVAIKAASVVSEVRTLKALKNGTFNPRSYEGRGFITFGDGEE